MRYPKETWDQLRNITVQRLMKALRDDGWYRVKGRSGASQAFVNDDETKCVTIHVHPKKTMGPSLLKGLLDDIGWDEDDLQALKLVKR